MRVLTVGNMYPPHHFGGYELVWQSAVEHLRARGHEVRVLSTDTLTGATGADPAYVHRELRWHLRDGEFEPVGLRERTLMARHNHRALDRHLADLRPEVVAWFSMGGLTLTMLEEVRRRGLPAVAFVHDEWLGYGRWADPWLHSFSGPRRRRLAPLAERGGIPVSVDFAGAASYVFVSEFMRRRAHALGLGLRRTSVAHSGIHPDYLDPAPEQDWGWRLLYVGRLDPRKGVDTAIEALAHLPPAARLRIVGGWDPREEQRLAALAARLGVAERVSFVGQRVRSDLLAEYEACDAVVFPVRWDEPWGLVPLEAMARGRPVVATGRGGSAEYLGDGENCLRFEADDAPALAAALRRLSTDVGLRARLREGGIATATRHTEPAFNAAVERAVLDAARPESRAPSVTRPLSILHLGTGFRPWRRGGLVAYVEDLAWEQSNQGHEVAYLFSGRQYRFLSAPRLKRWQRRDVTMLEVINSPLYDHGRQPELELAEPRLERMLEWVLAERRPDVLHVQELAGWPSSVLDVARGAGVPVVFTLQDYFALCSTFKLLDSGRAVCLRSDIGADCVATTAQAPTDPALLFEATMRYDLHRRRLVRRIDGERRDALVTRLAHLVARGAGQPALERELDVSARASAFQRRRDANVERLNQTDRLIAMSGRVAEIYARLGVEPRRLQTMRLTLAHVERLVPRRRGVSDRPVTFATLGGGESEAKGAGVLLGAARALFDEVGPDRFRLLIHGYVAPAVEEQAVRLPGVELRGLYMAHELDDVLEDVDVGIMPSIWEEAYGYAGVEFLAAGIPVIANQIGGMAEYVREHETGWLNPSCTAEGLARVMRDVIERPEQVAELSAKLLADHHSVVLPLADHAEEMDAVYREVIAGPSSN